MSDIPEPPKPVTDDLWIEQYSALLPAANAHALGMVGFMWNGCERRLLDLYWLARGLRDEDKNGPDKALRASEIQKATIAALNERNAPALVIREVEYLFMIYTAHRIKRNSLSHYVIRSASNSKNSPMKLIGFKRGQTFEIDDDLSAIREVADGIADFMPYLNETLIWAHDLMEHGDTHKPSPSRPPPPRKPLLRPHPSHHE